MIELVRGRTYYFVMHDKEQFSFCTDIVCPKRAVAISSALLSVFQDSRFQPNYGIEDGVWKFRNLGPPESFNFIIQVIIEKAFFQSRKGSRFTGAPALIIKFIFDLG